MKKESTYPVGYSDHVLALFSQRSIEAQAQFVIPYLKPGLSVLDCGCGPGSISLGFAEKVFPGKVVGIDIQSVQLDYARKLASEKNIKNINFYPGNATDLAFPDQSFDIIYSNALLCHLKNPLTAIKEFKRVLKPNGIVFSREMDWGATLIYPENKLLRESNEVREKALNTLGCNYRIGRQLRELYCSAGFKNISGTGSCEVIPSSEPYYKDVPEYMAQQWDTAPYVKIVLENGWATKERIQEYQKAIREFTQIPGAYCCWTWCEVIAQL